MLDCLIIIDHDLIGLNEQDPLMYKQLQLFHKFWRDVDLKGFKQNAGGEILGPRIDSSFSLTGVVLGTSLYNAGHSFVVFEGPELPELWGKNIAQVLREGVHSVAISSTYHTNISRTQAILEFIRNKNSSVKIIVGGQGLYTIRQDENIFELLREADILFFGDGELAFPEIVSRIKAGLNFDGITGAIYKSVRGYKETIKPATIDFETVPIPDFSVARMPCYNPHLPSNLREGFWSATMEEGRGCLGNCRFCSVHMNNRFRHKHPKRILKELQRAADSGIKSVFLCGSNALNTPNDIIRLCKLISKAKLGLTLSSYARLDTISEKPQIADYMREAGWKWLFCGIESGDPEILSAMKKKVDIDRIPSITEYLQKQLDIQILASFIIGYPGECSKSLENTKSLMDAANFHSVGLRGLSVLPNTTLYHMREQFGLKLLNHYGAWEHFTMNSYEVPALVKEFFFHITTKTESIVEGLFNIALLYLRHYEANKATALASLLQEVVAAGLLPTQNRNIIWSKLQSLITNLGDTLPKERVNFIIKRINNSQTQWWEPGLLNM